MRNMKKLVSLCLVFALTLSLGFPVRAASGDQPVLALGSDLSAEQRAAVLGLLGVSEADLAGYHVIYVTNQEEHQYLDAYYQHQRHRDAGPVVRADPPGGGGGRPERHHLQYQLLHDRYVHERAPDGGTGGRRRLRGGAFQYLRHLGADRSGQGLRGHDGHLCQ